MAARVTDPIEAAGAAGLRYVSDHQPGIRRRRSGKGLGYLDPEGRPVRDPALLRRIRSLAIPPAYTDVWICPDPRGHIQATGRDAKGRKQYRYHPRWREVRDATKFDRMLDFSEALPRIRSRVDADLGLPGLPKAKVLAAVVRLLESTGFRVGNDEYARANQSFGLTTLKDDHVEVSGSEIRFEFRGKSGKLHSGGIRDRRLARIIRRCQDLPGEELFQYLDEDGARQSISSGDVNEYLRQISGEEFTAKDFRTWSGTILAAAALEAIGAGDSATQSKKNVLQAIDRVAEQLNNTRAVCRKYYVHPAVLEAYADGGLPQVVRRNGKVGENGAGLEAWEAVIVRLLRQARKQAA